MSFAWHLGGTRRLHSPPAQTATAAVACPALRRCGAALLLSGALLGLAPAVKGQVTQSEGHDPQTHFLSEARGVMGLLVLPRVLGESACDRFEPTPLTLFATATGPQRVGQVLVRKPWMHSSLGGCEGLDVKVALDGGAADQELPTMERGYESLGAIVLGRQGRRVQIRLSQGTAWVDTGPLARFEPVHELLGRQLLFLVPGAPRAARVSPGGAAARLPAAFTGNGDAELQLQGHRWHKGRLWLHFQTAPNTPCDAVPPTTTRRLSFWLPLHADNGLPNVWYHARGC